MPLKLMLTIVLGGGLSTSSLFRDKCEGRGSFMTEMFSDRNVFFLGAGCSFMTELRRMLLQQARHPNSCGARDRPLLPPNLRPYYTCRTLVALL